MMKLHTLICVLCAAAVVSGCSPSRTERPPTGKSVTVQFRRDALGSAHTLPVSPTTDIQNGVHVSLGGTLSLVNTEWIVLKREDQDYWIPRDAILLIRVND